MADTDSTEYQKPVYLGDDSPSDALNSYNTPDRLESPEVNQRPYADKKQAQSAYFDVPSLESLVGGHALYTSWEQAFMCPCLSVDSKSPNPTCPICHGRGFAYMPAVPNVAMVITNQSKGPYLGPLGMFESGTAFATVQRGFDISFRDRITIPELTVRQSYMFNLTDSMFSNGAYIPYDIKKFIYVTTISSDNNLIELHVDKDFKYDSATHKIYFINRDMVGKNISINMTVTLRYIVSNLIKETRYQYNKTKKETEKLFPRLLMKREDVFTNNIPIISNHDSASRYTTTETSDDGFSL